jgi:hypothetical protein
VGEGEEGKSAGIRTDTSAVRMHLISEDRKKIWATLDANRIIILLFIQSVSHTESHEQKKWGGSERHYVGGRGVRNYISDFEGSQAVPACPSGVGRSYNRKFLYFYDAERGAL